MSTACTSTVVVFSYVSATVVCSYYMCVWCVYSVHVYNVCTVGFTTLRICRFSVLMYFERVYTACAYRVSMAFSVSTVCLLG